MRPLLLLAVAAPLAAAAPVPKELKRQVNYCPLAVGDKREYAHPDTPDVVTQVREITAVEERDGARYYTQSVSSSGQKNVMRADKTGVYMTEQSIARNIEQYDPPYKVVASDMKDGDKWDCKDSTGMTRTVGKAEKIATPAGTFTAVPITVSYAHKVGTWPTGAENPELCTHQRSNHGHDGTIVNGIGRIGWMTGGKQALWKDELMAQTYVAKANAFMEAHKNQPFFLYYATHEPLVPEHGRLRVRAIVPAPDLLARYSDSSQDTMS